MTASELYRVYAAPTSPNPSPQPPGGKLVRVFATATGDLQAKAAGAGAPLSAFIEQRDEAGVHLRIFTPQRDKGESDSAAVAALAYLQAAGQLADVASVWMNGQEFAAQLCGGEWLLRQGDASATPLSISPRVAAQTLNLGAGDLLIGAPLLSAEAGRRNLLLGLRDFAALDAAAPDLKAIAKLNRVTNTLGLVAYTLPGRRREDTDFRYFAPLKHITEDNASSHTWATLLAGLSVLGHLNPAEPLFRASQGYAMQQPSRLSAQARLHVGGAADVWVGGWAQRQAP